MTGPIKILVVDDLPEKLLVYQSVLEEPGLEILTARTGGGALKQVLQHDFAVILLDINMPDMDGFEAASMIRSRKRSAHTPIIFITAFADELHAIKSYSYGAVDYILSPIVPDVLRTKVRVFVELFRKTQEIQRQAEALREVQAREHRRQLWETNERLRMALDAGRMGACEWDLGARLLSWSPMIETIFGFSPGEFTGSAEDLQSRLHPEDRDRVLECMAEAVRTGCDFRVEHRILKPAASLSRIQSNGVAHAAPHHETVWVELRGRVFTNEDGQPSRIAGVCMDITERKEIEEQLAAHRAQLEHQVNERTRELENTYKRLRLADRLASIGTLAAGLGHDMGNLLLPVRMRLEALQRMELPTAAVDDVKAIQTATEYLKRLSQGLRLFALDPDEPGVVEDGTNISAWWLDVEPFFRNALPRHVTLSCEFHASVPPIAMPSHRFTQVIYNLVQNAGDAMRSQPAGEVRIIAALDANGDRVIILVRDDGPGMSDEVKQRCMDPFFTTKTRAISTGLGLALVRGAVMSCGGHIEIETAPGNGTMFRLSIPVRAASHAKAAQRVQINPPTAVIALRDARMKAYAAAVLRSLRIHIADHAAAEGREPGLLVCDDLQRVSADVQGLLDTDATRRVVVIGDAPAPPNEQIFTIARNASPARIREALHEAVFSPAQEKVSS